MERDKLIEYISDKLIHNAGKSTAHISIPVLEAILTSLTAPVPDGKVTDEEIIAEARLYAGSNYSKNHFPDHYENRLTGFIDGAKTICNKLTK